MMKPILTALFLATGILSASCQSNKYKIEVTCDAIGQNDTLYVFENLQSNTPSATIIGVDGKYEMEGTVDSTHFAVIASFRKPQAYQTFFIEPGTIKINLSAKPAQGKTSGTPCNEAWQEFNDTIISTLAQVDALTADIQNGKLTEQEQEAKKQEINAIGQKRYNFQGTFAKKHINDEVGYHILVTFASVLQDHTKAELLELLPGKFAKRAPIVALKKQMKLSENTAVGKALDDYTMDDIDGKPTSILSLVKQNKLTVIDFWASWCGPCRAEMPTMVKMHADNKAKGLGIIGISLDNNKEKWAAAIKQLGITWPQLSDLKGWDNGFAKLFAVNGIPYTVVIDEKGTILQKGLRGEDLVQYVEETLK